MKKVVYETNDESGVGFGAQMMRVSELERCGHHVVVYADVPDEPSAEELYEKLRRHFEAGKNNNAHNPNEMPKPEFERCIVHGGPHLGQLTYFGPGGNPRSLVCAMDDACFAGFEFEDGTVDRYPWKHRNNGERCYSANFVDEKRVFDEHAKYVLFRL